MPLRKSGQTQLFLFNSASEVANFLCGVASQHDGESCVSARTARFDGNPCQRAEHTSFLLLCLWQTPSFIVRLRLILVAVILLLASLSCTLSMGPAPLLAGVRLKGEGCQRAREPAVKVFIFPYSAILRI